MPTLTPMQDNAVKMAEDWYAKEMEQLFKVAGYAGTGKSTIVNELVQRLGLKPFEVAYVTFTGKAALVLTIKGNPTTTIHRKIYEVREVEEEIVVNGVVKGKRKKIVFDKKPFLDPLIKVIVVDEVGMVAKKLFEDLKGYGIKMICLGDPGQLPPIGDDNGVLERPDIFLTEIHRQAQDNPIIYLSMLARERKRIEYGAYGKHAVVIPKSEMSEKAMTKADIILCGKNNTRQDLNNRMRKVLGYKGELPNLGEKLICTKNNWSQGINFTLPVPGSDETTTIDISLINGLIGYVRSEITDVDYDFRRFRLDFRPEFVTSDYFEGLYADMELFKHFENDLPPWMEEKGVTRDKFEFGYAITVHKSQGSGWEKVLLYNEVMNPRDHHRWLYTGITRSSNKLILAL